MIFNIVILSFNKNAERIITITGDKVVITELLMGVDIFKPLKKKSILITIPNSAHATNLGQSFRSIFSQGLKRLTSQNKTAAPVTRSKIKPKGSI